MQIAIGCDHGGYTLKQDICLWLQEWKHHVEDFGTFSDCSVDYPDYAAQVAQAVARGQADLGILICGTGIGMAISANKVPGIRAANASDSFSSRMLREHNNGNVLCLGARVCGKGLAKEIVEAFLNAEFAGGRHQRRVNKINALDERQ